MDQSASVVRRRAPGPGRQADRRHGGDQPLPRLQQRLGRATAKVRRASAAYTEVVAARTGQPNPFVDFLDPETIESLRAERDRIANGGTTHLD